MPWWQWRSLGLSGTYLWLWCCNNDCGHSYIVFSHDHIVAINKVAISAIIITFEMYWQFSASPWICLQTADGSYKLVGIVNWGGGYCGEVQSQLQHCFLRKQLRSLFSREFAKSNPITYSYLIFVTDTTDGVCVKKMPGVNFYRFNARNWHFLQI